MYLLRTEIRINLSIILKYFQLIKVIKNYNFGRFIFVIMDEE